MNLIDELENMDKTPRNRLSAALEALGEEEREAWKSAVLEGAPSQVKLAALLTKHTGIEVHHKQVSEWKRRNL